MQELGGSPRHRLGHLDDPFLQPCNHPRITIRIAIHTIDKPAAPRLDQRAELLRPMLLKANTDRLSTLADPAFEVQYVRLLDKVVMVHARDLLASKPGADGTHKGFV